MTYTEFKNAVEDIPATEYQQIADFCARYPTYAQRWFKRMSEEYMQGSTLHR